MKILIKKLRVVITLKLLLDWVMLWCHIYQLIARFFFVASSDGNSSAIGFRIVCYNNFGGWGKDENYYLNFDNSQKLKSILSEAINEDRLIKSKIEKLITVAKQ
jgi:hypothetical protein